MTDPGTPVELIAAVVRLRQALVDNPLPFEAPDAGPARVERGKLIKQLDDYVLPRLLQIEAPLLVVVGGPTGAGKSTLVNSLVGSRVTASGVLRPTTRSPVLVHHVDDERWFTIDRLLPELERTHSTARDQGSLQLVPSSELPPGIAILDAPDLDSVEARNRDLSAQLMSTADLWLFVTSAARYADQVPWTSLKSAAERGAAVAVVLDRTLPSATREVSSHLARMLTARGLADARLFTIAQSALDEDGLLPPDSVAPIRAWLGALAADAAARAAVVRQTLDGTMASIGHRARSVSAALRTQQRLATELREHVIRVYAASQVDTIATCLDGSLLRGELLARWQDFLDTGELMRGVEDRRGRLRDRLRRGAGQKPQPAETVRVALEARLSTHLFRAAQSAAVRTAGHWRSGQAGAALLETSPADLSRAAADLEARVNASCRDWLSLTVDLVRSESADRQATSRFLAHGAHGLAAALQIVVVSSTAPEHFQSPTWSGRRVLGGVFGGQTMQRLTATASADLASRVEQLWRQEKQRFLEVLPAHAPDHGAAERLVQLSRDVDDNRLARAQA